MRNSLLDLIIDGPLGKPLIWAALILWCLVALVASPFILSYDWLRRQAREWREAIKAVDEGGDVNG